MPDMVVERGTEAVKANIATVRWRGMRCKVTVETNSPGLQVDLRLHPRKEDSSIVAAAKELDESGELSLAVADDRHEGAAAIVVLWIALAVLDQKHSGWRRIMAIERSPDKWRHPSSTAIWSVASEILAPVSSADYVVEFL